MAYSQESRITSDHNKVEKAPAVCEEGEEPLPEQVESELESEHLQLQVINYLVFSSSCLIIAELSRDWIYVATVFRAMHGTCVLIAQGFFSCHAPTWRIYRAAGTRLKLHRRWQVAAAPEPCKWWSSLLLKERKIAETALLLWILGPAPATQMLFIQPYASVRRNHCRTWQRPTKFEV